MTDTMLVQKTVHVKASPERAFQVFTAGMTRWWPKTHHISPVDFEAVVVEPKAGGRWYERGVDGSECDWGTVDAWQPPGRVVLVWQLNAEWQFDASIRSEVEVTFTAEPGGTRVVLEHRNIEIYGAKAQEMWSALDGPGGWGGMLDVYATTAAA